MASHEAFGDNLRRLREGRGLTQEALGFRADVHRTGVGLDGARDDRPAHRHDAQTRRPRSASNASARWLAGIAWSCSEAGPASGTFTVSTPQKEAARWLAPETQSPCASAATWRPRAGARASPRKTSASAPRCTGPRSGLLERGERVPRIDTAVKLAGSVDATVADLLVGIEWIPGSAQRGEFVGGVPTGSNGPRTEARSRVRRSTCRGDRSAPSLPAKPARSWKSGGERREAGLTPHRLDVAGRRSCPRLEAAVNSLQRAARKHDRGRDLTRDRPARSRYLHRSAPRGGRQGRCAPDRRRRLPAVSRAILSAPDRPEPTIPPRADPLRARVRRFCKVKPVAGVGAHALLRSAPGGM